MTASQRSEPVRPHSASGPSGSPEPPGTAERDDSDLLAALLDGMDAALCAFDADTTVTHWNREAERILGWTAREAVGRRGLSGWAVREADAPDVEARLMGAMDAAGRQVHEFALVTKEGGRVLVRIQSSAVQGTGGRPAGVYCAFSEVHSQIDLERSLGLSDALLEDASWGVVLVDADLRPAAVNGNAARALHTGRTTALGRPLGELLDQGVEDLENALQYVLAEGAPPEPVDLWVTLRDTGGGGEDVFAGSAVAGSSARRCWRSAFLRLASPLAEEAVPLGVAWLFQDVTETKRQDQVGSRLRFRGNQLYRAARAAAECEDPVEAATLHLDFALAGFADHALIDLVAEPPAPGPDPQPEAAEGGEGAAAAVIDPGSRPVRLVRVAVAPHGISTDPCPSAVSGSGIPVPYVEGHPALQAAERGGSVRASAARTDEPAAAQWAAARRWPDGTVHGLCSVLRSRGRTLGVATFLRGGSRAPFDHADAAYAEDVAVRVAAALDLARQLR